MKVSPRGAFAIAAHEGIVPAAYLDSVGVRTFGIGHTASAGDPDPAQIPMQMPDDLGPNMRLAVRTFLTDLAKFERRVNEAIKVPVDQHQFDALVSFDFNTGGIYRAKLTQRINEGDAGRIRAGFMGWTKAGGKVREYLKRRRAQEADMFLNGTYPDTSVPVWRVGPGGRPWFSKAIKNLGMEEFTALLAQKPGLGGEVYPPAVPRPEKSKEPPTGAIAAPAVAGGAVLVGASWSGNWAWVAVGALVLAICGPVLWRVMKKRKE